jgi:small subunit ribosomal protein S8
MFNDPIADILTRLKNGQQRRKSSVYIEKSKLAASFLRVLKEEGFISDFTFVKSPKSNHEAILVDLKYFETGTPAINFCKRVSKGGRRVYQKSKDLDRVKSGLGISIISTSKGLMSDRNARSAGVGGETLASVY